MSELATAGQHGCDMIVIVVDTPLRHHHPHASEREFPDGSAHIAVQTRLAPRWALLLGHVGPVETTAAFQDALTEARAAAVSACSMCDRCRAARCQRSDDFPDCGHPK